MRVLNFGVLFLLNGLNFLVFIRLLKIYATEERFRKKEWIIGLIGAALILSIANMWQIKYYNLLIGSGLFLALSYMFVWHQKWLNLFLTAMYIAFNFISEYIYFWLTSTVLADYTAIHPEKMYYISFFFSSLLNFFFVQMIAVYAKRKRLNITSKIAAMFLIFPVASVAFIAVLTLEVKTAIAPPLYILTLFMLLAFNFLIFFAIDRYNHYLEEKHQNALMLQETKSREEYFGQVEAASRETRKIRHDLKNQLIALSAVIQTDSAAASQMVREMIGEIDALDAAFYTQNPVFNTILTAKLTQAAQEGIEVRHQIRIPRDFAFNVGEAGVLLGNLLDNAIEACRLVPPGHRSIAVRLEQEGSTFLIVVENSKRAERREDGMATSKGDQVNHGFGLKSVARVVEAHAGVMKVEDKGETFLVCAMLYEL